ncbi:MAG: hypothetical protein Tsb0020_09480 [Haliangiales bacterium]
MHRRLVLISCLALSCAGALAAPAPASAQTDASGSSATANAARAGDAPVIELITMGPGQLLWERYGHAALCVRYAKQPRRDRCYNYGTTNFSEPAKLVWDFLRGRALMWVSVTTPERMMRFYSQQLDRTVWSQTLPFTPEEAQIAASVLEESTLEENKYYKYHHYNDNCATRIRDILDRLTDGALSADPGPYEYTLREITRNGMAEFTVLTLLTDFPLGRSGDRRPTTYEAMHLPFVLRAEVERRLNLPPKVLYERRGRSFNVTDPPSRWWLLGLAVLIGLPALITRMTGRRQRLGLAISALPAVILGPLMWFMAIISVLPEIRYNEVVLVLWPTDFLLLLLSPPKRRLYARVRLVAVAIALLLSAIGVLHQPLWALAFLVIIPCAVAAFPATPARAAASADADDDDVYRTRDTSPGRSVAKPPPDPKRPGPRGKQKNRRKRR